MHSCGQVMIPHNDTYVYARRFVSSAHCKYKLVPVYRSIDCEMSSTGLSSIDLDNSEAKLEVAACVCIY